MTSSKNRKVVDQIKKTKSGSSWYYTYLCGGYFVFRKSMATVVYMDDMVVDYSFFFNERQTNSQISDCEISTSIFFVWFLVWM